MDANFANISGVLIGAVLTLLVLSYLIRDTFLFRLAQSLLVGTAIGYGLAVILRNVWWEGLFKPLLTGSESWGLLILPLLGGIFLLTKLVRGWNLLGNISLGYLFGVGAALAIAGALSGALAPQLSASVVSIAPSLDSGDWINNLLIVVGTLGALLAFRFTSAQGTRPERLYTAIANGWGRIGRGFIMIAFGAILANVLAARIVTLVGQLYLLFHDAPVALLALFK